MLYPLSYRRTSSAPLYPKTPPYAKGPGLTKAKNLVREGAGWYNEVEGVVGMKRYYGLPLAIAVTVVVALAASCRPVSLGSVPVPVDSGVVAASPAEPTSVSELPDEFGVVADRPVTPTAELHTTGIPQDVDIETYSLKVEGLVETPLSLTYQDILAYPSVTEVVLLICPGVFTDNAEWTGVPVWRVLEAAGVSPEAIRVMFEALPDQTGANPTSMSYFTTLSMDDIKGNDDIFLAYKVNGETLPVEHGYPLRLVVKDEYGSSWVKWLGRITVE